MTLLVQTLPSPTWRIRSEHFSLRVANQVGNDIRVEQTSHHSSDASGGSSVIEGKSSRNDLSVAQERPATTWTELALWSQLLALFRRRPPIRALFGFDHDRIPLGDPGFPRHKFGDSDG
jgi:hypothetical protein